jgi:putative transposase
MVASSKNPASAGFFVGGRNGFRHAGEAVHCLALKAHDIVCSMSRRGNCYDNDVAESFFQLFKRERIKRKIFQTCDTAAMCSITSRCSIAPNDGTAPTEASLQ